MTFSAPGKVVLIGEYTVLEKGAAYVRAIDVRARARLEPHASKYLLEAPDINIKEIEFQASTTGKLIWRLSEEILSDPPELGLAGAVLAGAFLKNPPPPCIIRLDTSDFFGTIGQGTRTKIGLGSSAALTVALDAAVRNWTAARERSTAHEEFTAALSRLQALHTEHQGGRGSGLDIAASLRGGTFVYRRDQPHARITPLPLPADLRFLCIWTGRSASTGRFLERLASWRRRNERAYERFMSELADVSDRGIDAAARAKSEDFCEALRDYARLLEALGAAASLEIVSPVHRRLAHLATRHGVTYKPSGAGGGDIGVAFAPDAREEQRFRETVRNEGFLVLSCTEASEGLRQEKETT